MGTNIPTGPNLIHPDKPSAVGSRNSLNRNGRDEYVESQMLIDEEVDKILNHISAKLPPEVLEDMHVGGTVKELLHNYFNQGVHNMFNRYVTTVEDEMGKKLRDLLDKEEFKNLNRYTPREIAELLEKVGGVEKFNTSEMERSIVNIYQHAQGHIQHGVYDLELTTNNILRQKVDVGAFVRGENTYAVVECSFEDSKDKPEVVTDIKLVINIMDEELISPIRHYQIPLEVIIKGIVSDHIFNLVDQKVQMINENLMDNGEPPLEGGEEIFEKLKSLESFMDHGEYKVDAKQFKYVPSQLIDAIKGIRSEIDNAEYDHIGFRESVKANVDNENLVNRGYNTAVNSLTSILDSSRMGYQHIENYKNSRKLVIREYEETYPLSLPDERYDIALVYMDDMQLREKRLSYVQQLQEIEREVVKLWKVVDKLYQADKIEQDFDDIYAERVAQKTTGKKGGWFNNAEDEDEDEEAVVSAEWNEITYIQSDPTKLENMNLTYRNNHITIMRQLRLMRSKLDGVYGKANPPERVIADQRLDFIQNQVEKFAAQYNPFHVQPGLVLDIDISTIKRKKTTMDGMSNVLNEFLSSISKGFVDTAYMNYSRKKAQDVAPAPVSFSAVSEESESEVTGVADIE